MDDHTHEHGTDHDAAMQHESLAEDAPRGRSRVAMWICAGVVAAVIVGFGYWNATRIEARVPLAVSTANAAAAGEAAQRAGVKVEWRHGHPWVTAADVSRASEAAAKELAQARPAHPSTSAAADESVFLSSESSRARRLAATMSAVEQMIESQAGVARARVVLAEAGRPGAPGAAYAGATAAATVTMTAGEMSQDLVDSVAALVSGCVPGLSTDHVAVIDAKSNRQRTPRTAAMRQVADARREREREMTERLRVGVPGMSDARVSVRIEDDGAPNAMLVFPFEYGQRVVDVSGSGFADETLVIEEDRLAALARALLSSGDGCSPPIVTVSIARTLEGTADAPAAVGAVQAASAPSAVHEAPELVERVAAQSAAGAAVAASVDRERKTPLGPTGAAARQWDAWTLVLLVMAVSAVGFGLALTVRRSQKNAAGAAVHPAVQHAVANAGVAELEEEETEYAPDGVEAADASDAVRADPTQAASVLRGWLDTGFDARVAHVVVALDSGAAGALLRAMPASLVNRVTVALAALRTPTLHELTEAADALTQEMAMLRDGTPLESAAELAAEGVA